MRIDERGGACQGRRHAGAGADRSEQPVRHGEVLQAARGKGIKPIVGCDVWLENESNRDQPARLLLLCQNRQGYGNLCELLSQAFRSNQHRGRAEIRRAWFADGLERRPDRPVRRASGRYRPGAAERQPRRRRRLAGPRLGRACFPKRFYLELQRTGAPQAEDARAADAGAGRGTGFAGGGDASGPVSCSGRFPRPRGAGVHRRRLRAGRPAPSQALSPNSSISRPRPRWRSCSPTFPRRCANSVEIAKRCNLTHRTGQEQAAAVPDSGGHERERIPDASGPRRAWPSA